MGSEWLGRSEVASLLRPSDPCSSFRREQSSNGGGSGRARSTAELLTMAIGGVDGVAASPHLREQQWQFGSSNVSQSLHLFPNRDRWTSPVLPVTYGRARSSNGNGVSSLFSFRLMVAGSPCEGLWFGSHVLRHQGAD
nr:hypothetical protein Iba_chr09cCG12200 [Ipomoea batatas]